MHFKGTITEVDFHPMVEVVKSFIQLRIQIDVTEIIMIEEYGTIDELSKKFEFRIVSDNEWDISGIVGRRCDVLRNAQGYHFLSYLK